MTDRAGRFWYAGILLTCAVVGCSPSTEPKRDGRPIRSDQVTDFATLYGRNCAGCHGADGQFGPAPPLNDPLFLAIVPDAVLTSLVTRGRPGTPMPAFSRKNGGTLTDEQVNALASGIKIRWKPASLAGSVPEYSPPPAPGDAVRGKALFDRACASCHGPEGRGGKDKVGPIHDPSVLALISDQAVRRLIITGRPDLKMPDHAGKAGRPAEFSPLTAADVADLTALVASWRSETR